MEERIHQLEEQMQRLIDATANLGATTAATYAINKCVMTCLVATMKTSGLDLALLATMVFENGTDAADRMEGEMRRAFLAELRPWIEFLHGSA